MSEEAMFNTVRSPAETVVEVAPTDPTDPVTLDELASEGFGWDSPLVTTPRDAIAVLAARVADEIMSDDLGRRCVTRETARRLFAERADAERRHREALARLDAELVEQAAANPIGAGVPAGAIPDGITPAAAMLQTAKDAQPRRQAVLEHALANDGTIEFHPIGPVQPP
jgi:hypothetical protein